LGEQEVSIEAAPRSQDRRLGADYCSMVDQYRETGTPLWRPFRALAPTVLRNRATHNLLPYPGRLLPAVAAFLVAELTQLGDVVLDPFCGSGTVLLEAAIGGRRAHGEDRNPLACLLSRAKTTPVGLSATELALGEIRTAFPDARESSRPLVFWDLERWYPSAHLRDLRRPVPHEAAEGP